MVLWYDIILQLENLINDYPRCSKKQMNIPDIVYNIKIL